MAHSLYIIFGKDLNLVDNIPFAATMIPVIKNLAATQGMDLDILAWTLAVGTDIGGSATPIGASANVVGIATAAKEGHIIKWGDSRNYDISINACRIGVDEAVRILIDFIDTRRNKI